MSDPETPNHKSCSKKQRTTASPDSSVSMSQTIQDWRHNEKETRDPLHAPDSTLIKVMMANGQQLQPMHALFSSIPLGELEVSHSLFSWEEVRGGQQHMYTSHSGLNTTATPHR